ncbi:MAG: M20/M25/M40 family metallo-hydrolase [Myxococcota bacterium]
MREKAAQQWLEGQLPAMEEALRALVEVNSFSANPDGGREVGRRLARLFDIPGLAHEVVPSTRFADHHVFRSTGDGRAPIGLVGHLDTVFPPGVFEGYRVDGDKRRGPGVLDMKGGLVVIAWAVKAVARVAGLDVVPPLRIVVVADEEVGSPEGAPLIRQELAGAQACLVFESGRANDAIVVERKGTGNVTARAHGRAAHAGNNYWDGANAIWSLARFVDRAQALSNRDSGVTVNVGTFAGGTSRNTVPAEASCELDLRFPTASARATVLEQLDAAAKDVAVPGTRVELEVKGGRLPMEKVAGTDALLAKYRAAAEAVGLTAVAAPRAGGGSDGNTAASMGIATLDALGPRGQHFHTPDEYIEVGTLVPKATAVARFLLADDPPGAPVERDSHERELEGAEQARNIKPPTPKP